MTALAHNGTPANRQLNVGFSFLDDDHRPHIGFMELSELKEHRSGGHDGGQVELSEQTEHRSGGRGGGRGATKKASMLCAPGPAAGNKQRGKGHANRGRGREADRRQPGRTIAWVTLGSSCAPMTRAHEETLAEGKRRAQGLGLSVECCLVVVATQAHVQEKMKERRYDSQLAMPLTVRLQTAAEVARETRWIEASSEAGHSAVKYAESLMEERGIDPNTRRIIDMTRSNEWLSANGMHEIRRPGGGQLHGEKILRSLMAQGVGALDSWTRDYSLRGSVAQLVKQWWTELDRPGTGGQRYGDARQEAQWNGAHNQRPQPEVRQNYSNKGQESIRQLTVGAQEAEMIRVECRTTTQRGDQKRTQERIKVTLRSGGGRQNQGQPESVRPGSDWGSTTQGMSEQRQEESAADEGRRNEGEKELGARARSTTTPRKECGGDMIMSRLDRLSQGNRERLVAPTDESCHEMGVPVVLRPPEGDDKWRQLTFREVRKDLRVGIELKNAEGATARLRQRECREGREGWIVVWMSGRKVEKESFETSLGGQDLHEAWWIEKDVKIGGRRGGVKEDRYQNKRARHEQKVVTTRWGEGREERGGTDEH